MNPFDPSKWEPVAGFDFTDITYHRAKADATVRVAFDRPEVRNAFRPHTVDELYQALDHARMDPTVGVVLLTGNGPSPRTAAGRSVPEVISASAAAAAISTPAVRPRTRWTSHARAGCTSWRCSG